MPMTPTPRQSDFLGLTCNEALYGGAAGGGKSEALLMWLAEGIHLPSYSGMIFRRTFKQLYKSNDSLVAKSHRLYKPLGGKWNGSTHQWRFPSGALIEMGGLDHANSIYDYQGPSFHRVAFDELTQFLESQYLYLFSRIREAPNFPILTGMRASANPGGEGHGWVKARFVTGEAIATLRGMNIRDRSPQGCVFWADGRAFVPARLADNPFLDFEGYVKNLMHLNPVDRERLLNGDWSVVDDAQIRESWLRYFTMQGQILQLRDADGKAFAACDERECRRFATIDTAGTSEDKTKESKGKPPSWSVMQIWDKLPAKFGNKMLLRHVWRKRVDITGLLKGIEDTYRAWQPRKVIIEDKHFGPAVVTLLRGKVPMTTISPGQKDKLERASDLLNMLEKGEVFLPQFDNEWRPALEAEWLSWQGKKDETADQIDTAAYAAWECKSGSSSGAMPFTVARR